MPLLCLLLCFSLQTADEGAGLFFPLPSPLFYFADYFFLVYKVGKDEALSRT